MGEYLFFLFLFLLTYIVYKRKGKSLNEVHVKQIIKKSRYLNIENDEKSKNSISILTYNILAQKFVKSKKRFYEYRPLLSLEQRVAKILSEIKELDSDVICLQEMILVNLNKYFEKELKQLGYDYYFYENEGSTMINLTGYKRKSFIFKEFIKIELDFMKFYEFNPQIFGNRGVTRLTVSNKKRDFFVYNVHFPWRPKYEFQRCLIMNLIFEDILKNCDSSSVVLVAGDFNSLPNSLVMKLINLHIDEKIYLNKNIFLDEKYVNTFKTFLDNSKKVKEMFDLQSSYKNYKNALKNLRCLDNFYLNHPDFTNFTQYFKGNIDYIFYSNQIKLNKIIELPSLEEAKKDGFYPSANNPSDHIKLYSYFTY